MRWTKRLMVGALTASVIGGTWFASSAWTPGVAQTSAMSAEQSESLLDKLPKVPGVGANELDKDILSLVEKMRGARGSLRGSYGKLLVSAKDRGVRGLVHMLNDADANLRWEAVSALGMTEDPFGVVAVRSMLADKTWGVRSEAAIALGKVGDLTDDKALLRELARKDENEAVRKSAMRGLEAMQHRAVTGKASKTSLTEDGETRPDAPMAAPATGQDLDGAMMSDDSAIGLDGTTDVAPTAPGSPAAPASMSGASGATISKPGAMSSGSTMRPARPADVSLMMQGQMPTEASPSVRQSDGTWAPAPRVGIDEVMQTAQKIDAFVDAKIKQVGLEASGQADDGAFLRRAWLDTTGVIPPSTDAADFVIRGGKGKRPGVVDDLLKSDDYLEYWSGVWTTWLIGNANPDSREYTRLRGWFRTALQQNMPYDAMVRHLITTTGPTQEDGAGEYIISFEGNTKDFAARSTRTFLGLPIQCAECHDHKSEQWTQENFYGVVAFLQTIDREEIYEEYEEMGQMRRRYIGS
ncbi:MAG: DUF1549 domain-containing protein, partial [Candidatus Poribacteria bacterium]|nr:DUF1549 domain-containing protein [Candidatus Poribacteria bacterium]